MCQTEFTDGTGESVTLYAEPYHSTELRIFMNHHIANEQNCVSYPQRLGVLPESMIWPGKKHSQSGCGVVMKYRNRERLCRTQLFWACPKEGCRITRSVRSTSSFFTYRTKNGRQRCSISLCAIMEMTYFFVHARCTFDDAFAMTGRARGTVCDWWNKFRVCSVSLKSQPMMVGTHDYPVQVFESYFSSRHKYYRARILAFDNHRPRPAIHDRKSDDPKSSSNSTKNNSGTCVAGPWVAGLDQNVSTVRFLVVNDRKGSTLIPLMSQFTKN